MRIGEIARRTGVSVSTLRAWERRYGVLVPERTEGGHRLYGETDVARVQQVQALVDDGWAVGAAARHLAEQGLAGSGPDTGAEGLVHAIRSAVSDFDSRSLELALDDALARLDPASFLDDVLVPTLRALGEGWQDDPGVIAREHFATRALHSRLTRLLRMSPTSGARRCLAFSPSGEQHDLGLLMASVALTGVGWRVHFLGADTPSAAIPPAAREVDPLVVLVAAVGREAAEAYLRDPADTGAALVVLGGQGFSPGDEAGLPNAVLHAGAFRDLPALVERSLPSSRAS